MEKFNFSNRNKHSENYDKTFEIKKFSPFISSYIFLSLLLLFNHLCSCNSTFFTFKLNNKQWKEAEVEEEWKWKNSFYILSDAPDELLLNAIAIFLWLFSHSLSIQNPCSLSMKFFILSHKRMEWKGRKKFA